MTKIYKEERIEKLRCILDSVLSMFLVVTTSNDCLRDGVNDLLFDDLEDSYQGHIAEEMNSDVLLTIDEKHFTRFNENSHVEVLSPLAFVEKYFS